MKHFKYHIYVVIPIRVYRAIIQYKLIDEFSKLLSLSKQYFNCEFRCEKVNYVDFRVMCVWLK